jgi:hypothetical protein
MRPVAMPPPPALPADLARLEANDDVDVDETPSLHTLARTWTDSLIDHRELSPRSVEEELLETAGVCEQLEAMASVAPPPIETASPPPHVVRYRDLPVETEGHGAGALAAAFTLGVLMTLTAVMAVPTARSSLLGEAQVARASLASQPSGDEALQDEATTDAPVAATAADAAPATSDETLGAHAVGALSPAVSPAAAATASTDAPQPFDPAVARAAVAAAASRAGACSDGSSKGAARVAVTFASSGRATRALLDYNSPLAGTGVGSCIARTMSGAQMPPFEGGPVTVTRTVQAR